MYLLTKTWYNQGDVIFIKTDESDVAMFELKNNWTKIVLHISFSLYFRVKQPIFYSNSQM